MNPAMYTFINTGLGMSTGKAIAQGQHAAVEAYELSVHTNPQLVDEWNLGGHYTKLVMESPDSDHLRTVERYLNDRGFQTVVIIDEGRTELQQHAMTALGVEIVDRDDPHTKATFSTFQTLKDKKPKRLSEVETETPLEFDGGWNPPQIIQDLFGTKLFGGSE